jgi:hypothetical protein
MNQGNAAVSARDTNQLGASALRRFLFSGVSRYFLELDYIK